MREATKSFESFQKAGLHLFRPRPSRSRLFRPGSFSLCFLGLCILGFSANHAFAQESDSQTFRVIVHQTNPLDSIPSDDLARIFMKKRSSWEGWEKSTLPIDRPNDLELRKTFSRTIHGKSMSALNNYWQRMIFSGRGVPPDTLNGDLQVFNAILANPGAVSYVAADAKLPDGVKELKIMDE